MHQYLVTWWLSDDILMKYSHFVIFPAENSGVLINLWFLWEQLTIPINLTKHTTTSGNEWCLTEKPLHTKELVANNQKDIMFL